MRITEVVERAVVIKIPSKLYGEIYGAEVDTLDDDSSSGKRAFASDMMNATPSGSSHKLSLSVPARDYLMYRAIPNMVDIAEDNRDRRLLNQLSRLFKMLSDG